MILFNYRLKYLPPAFVTTISPTNSQLSTFSFIGAFTCILSHFFEFLGVDAIFFQFFFLMTNLLSVYSLKATAGTRSFRPLFPPLQNSVWYRRQFPAFICILSWIFQFGGLRLTFFWKNFIFLFFWGGNFASVQLYLILLFAIFSSRPYIYYYYSSHAREHEQSCHLPHDHTLQYDCTYVLDYLLPSNMLKFSRSLPGVLIWTTLQKYNFFLI